MAEGRVDEVSGGITGDLSCDTEGDNARRYL